MASSSEAVAEGASRPARTGGLRSVLVGAVPPALVVAPVLLGASAVDTSTLVLGPLAFLLVAGVGYGWRFGDDGWDAFGRGFAGAAVGLQFGYLAAGLVFGVDNGFEFAHLGALLVALS